MLIEIFKLSKCSLEYSNSQRQTSILLFTSYKCFLPFTRGSWVFISISYAGIASSNSFCATKLGKPRLQIFNYSAPKALPKFIMLDLILIVGHTHSMYKAETLIFLIMMVGTWATKKTVGHHSVNTPEVSCHRNIHRERSLAVSPRSVGVIQKCCLCGDSANHASSHNTARPLPPL